MIRPYPAAMSLLAMAALPSNKALVLGSALFVMARVAGEQVE